MIRCGRLRLRLVPIGRTLGSQWQIIKCTTVAFWRLEQQSSHAFHRRRLARRFVLEIRIIKIIMTITSWSLHSSTIAIELDVDSRFAQNSTNVLYSLSCRRCLTKYS